MPNGRIGGPGDMEAAIHQFGGPAHALPLRPEDLGRLSGEDGMLANADPQLSDPPGFEQLGLAVSRAGWIPHRKTYDR